MSIIVNSFHYRIRIADIFIYLTFQQYEYLRFTFTYTKKCYIAVDKESHLRKINAFSAWFLWDTIIMRFENKYRY